MWHPFKKVTLEAVTSNKLDDAIPEPIIKVSNEVQKAQLRSLKARTEITMIYDRLAENALSNIKGNAHAANI